jgi:hypothetical protein
MRISTILNLGENSNMEFLKTCLKKIMCGEEIHQLVVGYQELHGKHGEACSGAKDDIFEEKL